jgi:eukaryotic-like serine/threonine-protein kinase
MTLTVGQRLGPYEIGVLVGAGGMGEVYRGRDTRLNRDVAIKVLPPGIADNSSRRARFEREAQAISQLSHPNICTIYDVGDLDGVSYLVMEFIDGQSLDTRLRAGPLRWTTALGWAIQIARAIDAAHRRGIIHRDLKPANVMITGSGIKLLDFGVAKLIEGSDADRATGALATTQSLTAERTLVGTLHYMSPEQLEGREVDARTDVFAFGAMLYEMLTGRKAFAGTSPASVSAAILTADPQPVTTLGRSDTVAPPELDHVLRRALAKNPDDRWQTARDLMHELQWILDGRGRPAAAGATAKPPGWRRLVLLAAAIGLVSIGVLIGSRFWSAQAPPATEPATMFTIAAPDGTRIHRGYGMLAVSPDGRTIAFLAGPESGPDQIWIRELDSVASRPVTGTEGATQPFWSPDSKSMGFVANNKLQRVDIQVGKPAVIAELSPAGWLAPTGTPIGSWVNADTIILARDRQLYRVPAAGGSLVPFVVPDQTRGESTINFPSVLSDDRFLYLVSKSDRVTSEVRVGSFDRPAIASIPVQWNVAMASGYLIYRRDNTLFAQPFDERRFRLTNQATAIVENIQYNPANGRTVFSASQETLAFRSQLAGTLRWKDRAGKPAESVGMAGHDWNPVLPPDGSGRVAIERWEPSGNRLVVMIIDGQGRAAAVSQSQRARFTVWSPDGRWVAYVALTADAEIRRVRADGSGGEEVLPSPKNCKPVDWSKDDRFILCSAGAPTDLWVLPLQGTDRTPRAVTDTPANESTARFSPDGKWIAYSSDEGGPQNIWVQAFPSGAFKHKISTAGGLDPSWRADQKELFYMALDGTLMAVPVTSAETLTTGTPMALFKTNVSPISVHPYAASADGRRFLVNEFSGTPDRITVVRNWTSLVR